MIVTTKRGDQGETSLFGAKRIPKHHPLIEINGQVDQIQVLIGLLKTKVKDQSILTELTQLQKKLYQIMAHVAEAKILTATETQQWTEQVEKQQAKLMQQINLENRFVIPGEQESEALAHLVRVEVRRWERQLTHSATSYPQLRILLPLANRLSDYFFVLSQYLLK